METIVELIFYSAILLLSVLSFVMIYVLLRFGRSKVLGLSLSLLYLFLMFSLFITAQIHLNRIPFGSFGL